MDKDVHSHISTIRRRIGIGVVILIALLIYYEFAAHYTPFTTDAYLQANVVQIAPQVDGRVLSVNVRNNSSVKKGDVLFQIDPRPYQYAVERLKAQVVSARQEVKGLQRKRDRAKAFVDQYKAELAYAQEHFDKTKTLEAEGAMAQIKRDKDLSALNAKKAQVAESQEQLADIEAALAAKVGSDYASVREVQARLDQAQFDLDHSTVTSPVDGYVTNLQLTPGVYAKVGFAVLTIVDTTRWWVVANFKENTLARIHLNQPAGIGLSIHPGRILKGRVSSFDWGVKFGQGLPSGFLAEVQSPKTWVKPPQRFPVRIQLEHGDTDFMGRVGASATVTVYTGTNRVFNGLSHVWLFVASLLDYIC
jgi:multidrug resistance efflux pump